MAKGKTKDTSADTDLLAIIAKLLVVKQTTDWFETSNFLSDLADELDEVINNGDDAGNEDEDDEGVSLDEMSTADLRAEVVKQGLLSKKKAAKTGRKKLHSLLEESNNDEGEDEDDEGEDEDDWVDDD